jgi:hypothetical protein
MLIFALSLNIKVLLNKASYVMKGVVCLYRVKTEHVLKTSLLANMSSKLHCTQTENVW